jgi:hypothetical protein
MLEIIKGVFSNIHCKNLVEFQGVKKKCRGLWRFLSFRLTQVVPPAIKLQSRLPYPGTGSPRGFALLVNYIY